MCSAKPILRSRDRLPRVLLAASAGLVLLAACEATPITRRVKLSAAPVLPSGASSLVGNSLRATAAGLEPLKESMRYVVWAVGAEATNSLGSLDGGTSLSATVDPVRMAAVRELRVTEEDVGSGPPTSPSTALRLIGSMGGTLAYVPVSAASLAAAGGEARADDTMLMVTTSLPTLEKGLEYRVWTRFPSSAGVDSHALSGDPWASEASALSPSGMVALGTLDGTGMLMADFPYLLATMQEVIVTVQSAGGQAGQVSPVRVLQGMLKLPAPGASAESAPHAH